MVVMQEDRGDTEGAGEVMTVGELKEHLKSFNNDLEIIVRCEWEGKEPNGTCFALVSVSEEDDHNTEEYFAAFDCDQQEFINRITTLV